MVCSDSLLFRDHEPWGNDVVIRRFLQAPGERISLEQDRPDTRHS
jgi:hypothetical protein